MVFDTVVDKAFLENGLKMIADAIRVGADMHPSEVLPFPDMFVTELERAFHHKDGKLQDAKAETKAFIERTKTNIYNEDVVRVAPFSHYHYDKLQTAEYPNAASAGESAFEECTALTSVRLPSAEIIGVKTFKGCTKLSSLVLPKVYEIRDNAFDGCTKLESIDLPALRKLGQYAFAGCTYLKTADLHNLPSIPNHAFRKATNLGTLYLRNNTVVTLKDVGAFYGIEYVVVYAPGKLIESYKAAGNWSSLFDDGVVSFLPIPGTEDDVNAVFFTIGENEYRADKDMTWAEWCDSEYNTLNPKMYIDEYGWAMLDEWNEVWKRETDHGERVSGSDIVQAGEYLIICP